MKWTHLVAVLGAAALIATGTGVAIGAAGGDEGKKAEDAILGDAAKRLDTTPEKLRDALAAAEDAQLDQAVKDGRLTQEQADRLKKLRQQSGRVLGLPGPHPHGFGGRGHGPGGPGMGPLFEDLAKALGISTDQLASRLRDGKTLAQIAKAEGKSLADVKSAVKAAAKKRLDAAVKSGDLTQKQADQMLECLTNDIEHLGSRRFRGRRGGPPPMGPPPEMAPDMAPGSAPVPVPEAGTVDA